MFKLIRRGPPRFIALSAVLLTVLLCIYYVNFSTAPPSLGPAMDDGQAKHDALRLDDNEVVRPQEPPVITTPEPEAAGSVTPQTCPLQYMADADIDTVDQFQKFDFQVGSNLFSQAKLCFTTGLCSSSGDYLYPQISVVSSSLDPSL